MPLAGRAKAHNEPQGPVRHAGLVGMGNNRRIEERGRFEGVLAGKKRAYEQLPGGRDGFLRKDMGFHPLEVGHQFFFEMRVPFVKGVADLFEFPIHFVFGQRQGTPDYGRNVRRVSGDKRANNHPRDIRK